MLGCWPRVIKISTSDSARTEDVCQANFVLGNRGRYLFIYLQQPYMAGLRECEDSARTGMLKWLKLHKLT